MTPLLGLHGPTNLCVDGARGWRKCGRVGYVFSLGVLRVRGAIVNVKKRFVAPTAMLLLSVVAYGGCVAGDEEDPGDETIDVSEQEVFDCNDDAQRLTCAEPLDPHKRFVCHATGWWWHPYVKIKVPIWNPWHVPGQRHFWFMPADQAPGASADDVGWGPGLDCACDIRECDDACTGAVDGAPCDDGDACLGEGTCQAQVCQAGEPICNPDVVVNEVESSGGSPGDWVELYNAGTGTADLSGWVFKDADDTHSYVLPAGTGLAAGAYLVLDEATFGFGLGGGDSARLFDAGGNVVDSHSWTSHSVTTYARCPDGSGGFGDSTTVTKGGANDCSVVVSINEVESSGGSPGDWVELYNDGPAAADLSGWTFKDNDDTHAYVLPAGTTVAAGAFLVIDEATFGFGLGGADSARLFDAAGNLFDSHSWTAHAATTYARCPDGAGSFAESTTSTKGTANDCTVAAPIPVALNEVESSGGVPGDWVEIYNPDTAAADLSGWVFKDNDDTHAYVLPVGTTVAAGGYLVLDEATFGFGLGGADSARLFDDAANLVDSHAWTAHAATTYGRCPDGTGAFAESTSITKGTANDCAVEVWVTINEVESSGGTPGDWVELHNAGTTAADISGWVFKDNDDTHAYVLPAGTTLAAGAYLVLDEATFGFGLGGADSARLYDAQAVVVDSYSWTAHAGTTYGRCPDGSGPFLSTTTITKGTSNDCGGVVPGVDPWPGPDAVTTVDDTAVFGGNLSGLFYEEAASDVLWAVRNGPSTMYRLLWNGSIWTPEAGAWAAGKTLRYPSGSGSPDAEDVTKAELSSSAIYVATERDNDNSGVSRLSILRFDSNDTSAELVATHEWDLTADLPAVGSNLGLEAIAWIPDSYLVAHSFFDASVGLAYDPADYPDHGSGLFFVGVEATGMIHAYALDHATGGFNRVSSFASGEVTVKALSFDRDVDYLWTTCGSACGNETAVMVIDDDALSPTFGEFIVLQQFARPTTMPNIANEGIAFAPESRCVNGQKTFVWSDDGETGGHALRADAIPCGSFIP
jgi:hypothetical protein